MLYPPAIDGKPVFSVAGAADQRLPLVVCSPHSGRLYPASMVAATRLSPQALAQGEDALVDQLIAPLAAQGAVVITANVARAYVDVNREANELDPALFESLAPTTATWASPRVLAKLGVIPANVAQNTPIYHAKLAAGEAERRLAAVYHPFHAALAELVSQSIARFGGCLLVDCHSMPPIRGGAQAVIGDRYGQSCDPWVSAQLEDALSAHGLTTARNRPFAGGAITQRFAKRGDEVPGAHDVQAVQIELARTAYLSVEPNGRIARRPNANFSALSAGLCAAIAALGRDYGDALGTAIAAQ